MYTLALTCRRYSYLTWIVLNCNLLTLNKYLISIKTVSQILAERARLKNQFGGLDPKLWIIKVFGKSCKIFVFVLLMFVAWNGMLRHLFGVAVIFISLQHSIAPALDLRPCLQAWGKSDCNKGIKFKKGAFNLKYLWFQSTKLFS